LWHESVWNYNASFAAHVYLWAGQPEWADVHSVDFSIMLRRYIAGREEQPLQHALVGQDWGDMPHNWASAECVRYLRHMLCWLRWKQFAFAARLDSRTEDWNENFRLEHTPTALAGSRWR